MAVDIESKKKNPSLKDLKILNFAGEALWSKGDLRGAGEIIKTGTELKLLRLAAGMVCFFVTGKSTHREMRWQQM